MRDPLTFAVVRRSNEPTGDLAMTTRSSRTRTGRGGYQGRTKTRHALMLKETRSAIANRVRELKRLREHRDALLQARSR
jgi:hypothetical protein